MAYTIKKNWVDYAVFGLTVFLIFCLLFESYIEIPPLVGWLGHWHPLVLHFPIVLLLICIFLGLTGKTIPGNLLIVTVLSTLITAIFGFFLGKETPIKSDLLFWHQWLGGGLAVVAVIMYVLDGWQIMQTIYSKVLQIIILVLIGFTGHYGGMITHGEDFLALPLNRSSEKIPENPLIFQDVVNRIINNNCISCHNPNKQKGELLMTSLKDLLEGGKSGNTLIPGNPGDSEILKRLHLPKEDEKHMPPKGKKPLSETEIAIIERWIALGASDTLRLDQLKSTEPLVALVKSLMDPDPAEKWAKLPKVADSTLQSLSSDYLTINRIATNSNALSISAYLPPNYDPKYIVELSRVAENIIELDLSGLPIGESEMEFVSNCKNLEWLEIDRTPVTDVGIENLVGLSHLKLIKVYQTNITDRSLSVFEKLENLKSLYLWETKISPENVDRLKKKSPQLLVDHGIEDELEVFFVQKDTVAPKN